MSDSTPWSTHIVKSNSDVGLKASTLIAVHRSFVNEPPKISLLEPTSGILRTFEDHAAYVSFIVDHKAADQLVGRTLRATLKVSHGHLRTLTDAASVRLSPDGRQIEYQASLYKLNDFLAQIEYAPDPNYFGDDKLFITVTDLEFYVNSSIPIEVASQSDPLTLVCPPAIDLFEGQANVAIGANITIRSHEPLPGQSDSQIEVAVELMVTGGEIDANSVAGANFSAGPYLSFNGTIADLRSVIQDLTFTPLPKLFNGVVRLSIKVAAILTEEEASCDTGLVIHPVNTAPIIHIDQVRLQAATNGLVKPYQDILLYGVIQLSDPDVEDYSNGWFTQRTLSARIVVRTSCGTLSLLMAQERDYVRGVQRGSIAAFEGLTFLVGDGRNDNVFEVISTMDDLNEQLNRLYYHSGGDCRDTNVTISVELDDLGNFGAGTDAFGHFGHPKAIVVHNQLHFQVALA
jgi:hypothetical protein